MTTDNDWTHSTDGPSVLIVGDVVWVREDQLRERIAVDIEAMWHEACAGQNNPDVCESCRAYGDVIHVIRSRA